MFWQNYSLLAFALHWSVKKHFKNSIEIQQKTFFAKSNSKKKEAAEYCQNTRYYFQMAPKTTIIHSFEGHHQ
jgi:hypothetical protein